MRFSGYSASLLVCRLVTTGYVTMKTKKTPMFVCRVFSLRGYYEAG
jgi:hypothetical protein